MNQIDVDKMKDDIEFLVGEYCDGTLNPEDEELRFSLEKAYFVERKSPQELADRLLALFCGGSWM